MNRNKKIKGFTLVELLVGVSVFVVIIVGVYNSYTAVYKVVSLSRVKIGAIDLANEQLEIVRNLSYARVGVSGGIPTGVLDHDQDIVRDGFTFTVTTTVRNIDDPFDGTLGGTPNDLSPADSKLVEVEVSCALCRNFSPITVTARVAPKNLETASTNGALFVRVFDANGIPVPQAQVHIENNTVSPAIVIDDETNNNGILAIVDAPPGTNAYEITVTKSGYSTDKTYTSSVSNPNPTKRHATVILQQVTTQSFVIDQLSTATVTSMNDSCSPVGNISFNVQGSKTIGTNPVLLKYNQSKATPASGILSLLNLEWDTYTISLTDSVYELWGVNPLLPVSIAPNSTQAIGLVVNTKNPRTLLVTVKDSSNNLPLSDATVELVSSGGSTLATRITGKGFLGQTDWSGGNAQASSTDKTKYFSSDGNVITNTPVGDVILRSVSGVYQTDGTLTSSSFDTGGISNFNNVVWSPVDQPNTATVRFQIATNDDGGTWNYVGPDGTASTFFTTANTNINSAQNGKRYLRYKMFLHTGISTTTPNVSDVAFTFTVSCTPPGQIIFSGLSSGNYSIEVSKTGYDTVSIPVSVSTNWSSVDVSLHQN
jgi:prepilin-type N-terminal cleavage/methylation domain-containing protein